MLHDGSPKAFDPDAVARRAFMADAESRLARIPGVESVGSVNSLPLASFDGDVTFTIEGEAPPEPGEQIVWLRGDRRLL